MITQIDVFEESNGADSELLETKGIDLQSCEEMFHTVYEKVTILYVDIYDKMIGIRYTIFSQFVAYSTEYGTNRI